jgi:hypothetical protein
MERMDCIANQLELDLIVSRYLNPYRIPPPPQKVLHLKYRPPKFVTVSKLVGRSPW